jgi:hypothetical protein
MPVTTSGLVAEYLLREGSGTVAHDTSGNGLDGTLHGAPTWDAKGLLFNANSDYVVLPDGVLANDDTSINAATLEVWFNPTGASTGYLVDFCNDDFAIWGDSTIGRYFWEGDSFTGSGYQWVATDNGVYSPGDWSHVVFTYDNSDTQLKIYLNGSLLESSGGQTGFLRLSSSRGAKALGSAEGSGSSLLGIAGEYRVYNRALTAAEILENYNSTVATYPPNTDPPSITSFTADPTTIPAGATSSLSFSVLHATSLSISSIGTVTGSPVPVEPTATTTYVLTATNAYGSETASVIVTVSGALPVVTFTLSKSIAYYGEKVVLTWNVSGADTISIDNGIGPVGSSGSVVITPTSLGAYIITATNSDGTVTKGVSVSVLFPTSFVISFVIDVPTTAESDGVGAGFSIYYNRPGVTGLPDSSDISYIAGEGFSGTATATLAFTAGYQDDASSAFGTYAPTPTDYLGGPVATVLFQTATFIGGHSAILGTCKIYEVYLTVTYDDGTVIVSRPTAYALESARISDDSVYAHAQNSANAYDNDITSFADISISHTHTGDRIYYYNWTPWAHPQIPDAGGTPVSANYFH